MKLSKTDRIIFVYILKMIENLKKSLNTLISLNNMRNKKCEQGF